MFYAYKYLGQSCPQIFSWQVSSNSKQDTVFSTVGKEMGFYNMLGGKKYCSYRSNLKPIFYKCNKSIHTLKVEKFYVLNS